VAENEDLLDALKEGDVIQKAEIQTVKIEKSNFE
jgi:hypothetical protein